MNTHPIENHKKVLLLGGTAEATEITHLAHERKLFGHHQHQLVYSLAGLVRTPDMPCEVISGGFSQFGGLSNFIKSESIDGILDVTHPFAKKISRTAQHTALSHDIDYWRFQRPPWEQRPGDNWHDVGQWDDAVVRSLPYQSLLITVGHLNQAQLNTLVRVRVHTPTLHIVIRAAVEQKIELPSCINWIRSIGPFNLNDELALMEKFQTDILISKNSGGNFTQAKLEAARIRGIAVAMITQQIDHPSTSNIFTNVSDCIKGLSDWLHPKSRKVKEHAV